MTAAQANALASQRLAVASVVCDDATHLNSPDELAPDQQAWVSENCSLGTVSSDSPLRRSN